MNEKEFKKAMRMMFFIAFALGGLIGLLFLIERLK